MLRRGLSLFAVVVMIGALNTSVLAAPTGHWSFDNQADPGHDNSGNGYNGTVTGATWTSGGHVNGALSFDGDDYVEVPNCPTFTTDVVLSAWVYVDNVQDRIGGYILNKGVYLTQETYSLGVTADLEPWVRVHVNSTPYLVVSPDPIPVEDWTHIVGIYDGNSGGTGLTLYVDDVDKGNLGVSGTLQANSESLYFGQDLGNSLSTWEGDIDEVSVTIPEPAALFAAGVGRCGDPETKATVEA